MSDVCLEKKKTNREKKKILVFVLNVKKKKNPRGVEGNLVLLLMVVNGIE